MKFKKNITITFACFITEFMLSCLPSIIIMYLLFFQSNLNDLFFSLLVIPYLLVIINIVLIIISLIACLFIKEYYVVGKKELIVNNKEKVKKICFSDIKNIAYDFGNIKRYNGSSSELIFFDENFNTILSVKNPSLLMVCMIRKRCRGAKTSFYNNKRIIILMALTSCIVIVAFFYLKFLCNNIL